MDKKEYLIIGIIMILALAKTYSFHAANPFPYHHDEWQHLAISMQAIEKGYNVQYNPYFGAMHHHADLESGFHLFISALFLMTGLSPLWTYQFLAALFSMLSAFAIYLCVRRMTGSMFAAIVSACLFSLLKSNVNILGTDYFVPMTMVIPFVFFFIMLITSPDKEEHMGLSFLVLGIIFMIHPPTFIILTIPAAIELAGKYKRLIADKRTIALLCLSIIIVVSIGAAGLWKGSDVATKRYLKEMLVFEKGWGRYEITYFVPYLYGIIPTLLALAGFIQGQAKIRIFSLLSFISLGFTAMYNLLDYTILIPYARAVFYSMIFMLPLSGYGMLWLLKKANVKATSKYAIAGVMVLLAVTFLGKYSLDEQNRLYKSPILDSEDYKALEWAGNNLGENNMLITPYMMTSAVYPVSHNRVISLVPAQMGGGLIDENMLFYNSTCDKKQNIAMISNASYVLSRSKIDCSFLDEIYSGRDHIYRITSASAG